ncbi:MAG: M18 family aminopeptidase [Clostridia bacterium]|nr:M18 family aminopeptidase [Clostridia bacterium]
MEKIAKLKDYLSASLTAFHAVENAKKFLAENGFVQLFETNDFEIMEGGKYYIERNGALLAFTVGGLDNFSYKIIASHVDSPALKLKENPEKQSGQYLTLNTETYGGGIWYSFFDRPLKIAGRIVRRENERVYSETVTSPYFVTIPSLAVHQNRGVNEGFAVNAQTDLAPLVALGNDSGWLEKAVGDTKVLAYDLYLVNADTPYTFGANNEFFASPRIDNLVNAYASLEALVSHADSDGICVACLMDNEEIGSRTAAGADGNFVETTLRRIAYALRFDDNEFYKALASSFLLSADNGHAMHPNHPEKCDPTNKTVLGGGVVVKSHANKAYVTDAISAALVKTVFEKAGVKYQTFFNRSDVRSGSTLGVAMASRLGIAGVDIGVAQLAMHSACECFAASDFAELINGLTAFYSSDILAKDNEFIIG